MDRYPQRKRDGRSGGQEAMDPRAGGGRVEREGGGEIGWRAGSAV